MKLNGWKRIGILASVAWVLGAGLHTLNVEGRRHSEFVADRVTSCEDSYSAINCDRYFDSSAEIKEQLLIEWQDAVIVAFSPIPFAWGSIYLIIFLLRWLKRGFQLAAQ